MQNLAVFALPARVRTIAARMSTLSTSLTDAFNASGLVPSVVAKTPQKLLQVSYGGKSVALGNELTTDDVANAPTEISFDADSKKLYTVLLTDPDAPSRENPQYGPWRHFVRVNANGTELNTSGDVITPYIGAKPPSDTGFHRYVWLAYEQRNGTINPPEVIDFPARRNWQLNEWLAENGLEGPVAGNFFEARNDTDRTNNVGTSSLKMALLATVVAITHL
ncbi:unnamed protein product, partial [Mesorhabditis belari]|uniref:Phosphatidylethanolamine-binding protein n=1 Tax=Mesorhabditis belari TaxID=2138241 RepID=A0AAF3ELZ3_9BILA